jgi:8-oxo-dGTP pyrophosphatase MutT (NUDIX family)
MKSGKKEKKGKKRKKKELKEPKEKKGKKNPKRKRENLILCKLIRTIKMASPKYGKTYSLESGQSIREVRFDPSEIKVWDNAVFIPVLYDASTGAHELLLAENYKRELMSLGGHREQDDDSAEFTALREACEEGEYDFRGLTFCELQKLCFEYTGSGNIVTIIFVYVYQSTIKKEIPLVTPDLQNPEVMKTSWMNYNAFQCALLKEKCEKIKPTTILSGKLLIPILNNIYKWKK